MWLVDYPVATVNYGVLCLVVLHCSTTCCGVGIVTSRRRLVVVVVVLLLLLALLLPFLIHRGGIADGVMLRMLLLRLLHLRLFLLRRSWRGFGRRFGQLLLFLLLLLLPLL